MWVYHIGQCPEAIQQLQQMSNHGALPSESFLRLCGGSSIILLRSPLSFRSTGFSHTDSCMVGLKKNTLSSPVQTTHLQTQREIGRHTLSHMHTHICSERTEADVHEHHQTEIRMLWHCVQYAQVSYPWRKQAISVNILQESLKGFYLVQVHSADAIHTKMWKNDWWD